MSNSYTFKSTGTYFCKIGIPRAHNVWFDISLFYNSEYGYFNSTSLKLRNNKISCENSCPNNNFGIPYITFYNW